MPHSWRSLRPVLLVMLVLTMIVPQSLGFAQDDETTTIVVAGSFQTQIQAVLEGVRDSFVADNADVDIQLALEGSEVGLRSLCAGEADLAVSTEPIGEALSATELANCVNQGPNFIETVLAYDAVVLVAPTSAQAICLPQEQAAADTPANSISGLWSLGSPAEIPWTNLGSTLESNIQFYGTADYTLAYQTFSNVLAAGDLRDDITVADPAAIIAAVQAENSSVMGFMSLSDWQQVNPADGSVTEVGILDTDTAGCVNPSVETIEARTYPLTRTVYLYVNADSVEKVQPFVEFALTNEQGVTAQAPAQGFTLPSETTLQTGVSNLATVRTGRTFTRPLSPVSTSPDQLLGAVDVVGSAMLSNLITNTVISSTTAAYPGVTVNSSTLGNTAGLESLCAGEPPADVLQATRSFTDEELANCNNPYALNLGADALVLAVPASLEGVSCVTSDQAQALLGVYIPPVMATPEPAPAATEEAPVAGATEEAAPVVTEEAPVATEEAPVVEATEEPLPPAPELWSDVNPDWPELEILAVLPPRSSGETDFLGATLFGTQRFTTRTDGAESDDPLYRAQGVANTDNGFTYLWWSDLQGSAADLKLVEVDAGNGCVAPSEETIADGSYPLSYSVNYYFNQTSLTDPAVRVFLWQFFSNTVLDQLAGSSLVGLDIDALRTTLRDEVFTMLEALDVPVVTEEPTPAATEEPEVSATEEVAPVATEEVTPVATEEVAPAATEEATPVATEPAPAVTEEATPAAE